MAGEIIVPGVEWRPMPGKSKIAIAPRVICGHTQVGRNEISYQIGAQAGHSYAHFYGPGAGKMVQAQDLRYRSAANLEGNPYIFAFEMEDVGPSFPTWNLKCGNVPAMTDHQVDMLIHECAWICLRFAIPPNELPNSKPNQKGLTWHRIGIDPWRVSGGDLWSSARFKCCPDTKRIAQWHNIIIPNVRQIVLNSTPTPDPGDDDMPYYTVITGPNKPPRLVVDNAVIGFPNMTELNEHLAAYNAAGYVRKNVKFAEADDWERDMKARMVTDDFTDLKNSLPLLVAAALEKGLEPGGIYVDPIKAIQHQVLTEHGEMEGFPPPKTS